MDQDALSVSVIPLARTIHCPASASKKTRPSVPPGYGRREQCRPFVEANGLGLTIPSPFTWGYCLSKNVPEGARAFRSPVEGGCPARVFYVKDDPSIGFTRNQYDVPDHVKARMGPLAIPGLSFFERPDQQRQIKLHLPYVLCTQRGVGLLFTPPINRPRSDGLQLLSGLVETAWYADAVNMVFVLPDRDQSVHIQSQEPLAQAIPTPMAATRTSVSCAEPHRKKTRVTLDAMADWRAQKSADRAAYKRIAKTQ